LKNYDKTRLAVIYGVNYMDFQKLVKNSYFQPYNENPRPASEHAYLINLNDGMLNGKRFSTHNIKEGMGSNRFTEPQKKKFFQHIFGWYDPGLYELLKEKFRYAFQSDTPPSAPNSIKEEIVKEIRNILLELGYAPSSATPQTDDDPDSAMDQATKTDAQKSADQAAQRADLVKQKQQSERDLKSLETDLKWKNNSILSLRKDQLPQKRKELDTLNQQINSPQPMNEVRRWHAPLDPDCPDNPLNTFYDDPMTSACGCADEIAQDLENKHRAKCKRCQEYGAANIEIADD